MEYYTSDWHLGEDRIGIKGKPNLFYRPFTSIKQQDNYIMNQLYNSFTNGDTLIHLGDVIKGNVKKAEKHLKKLRSKYPDSTFNLILGNYDMDKIDILKKYFNNITAGYNYLGFYKNYNVYLNHYPTECIKQFCFDDPFNDIFSFAITGHVHGLWKVQKRLINVSVDAWHFKPVSKDEIIFCWNAMANHYDENVFPY